MEKDKTTKVDSTLGLQAVGSQTDGDIGSLLGNLAKKVRNIDGKMVGKDGKPLKAKRYVTFDDNIAVSKPIEVMEGQDSLSNTLTSNVNNEVTNVSVVNEKEACDSPSLDSFAKTNVTIGDSDSKGEADVHASGIDNLVDKENGKDLNKNDLKDKSSPSASYLSDGTALDMGSNKTGNVYNNGSSSVSFADKLKNVSVKKVVKVSEMRNSEHQQGKKQIAGVRFRKPKPKMFYYRPVSKTNADVASTIQTKEASKATYAVETGQGAKSASLMMGRTPSSLPMLLGSGDFVDKGTTILDSDGKEIDEYIEMHDKPVHTNDYQKEASTSSVGARSRLEGLCKKVFRNWDWTSNGHLCAKGSRIILGWNQDDVDLTMVAMDDQQYVRNRPWCLLGDFNYALHLEDKLEGSSVIDIAMREFKECVDEIEVFDVNRSGLQFTWNQKPRGTDGTLKKIDRIMANLECTNGFVGAHAIFQPYRVSDHSPAILTIPTSHNNKMFRETQDLNIEVVLQVYIKHQDKSSRRGDANMLELIVAASGSGMGNQTSIDSGTVRVLTDPK
ncbi:RNA-directed DNA polymerase, eukaryota, Reverse transcriptase zinc-binding domain protein [Artemisia annua]|uniref:RNA-directed DNA polymerase, eukaryota, Reverse transcriptase zinc-binding domain protein n=1 Tax=Artemisia annua TaxID=35608 RepID=A0A2U1P4V2_ARTAN|nr:RNA-directed DNA polymerase, eukaryota, Reverse transcriptase zinc-binding domain protein [Artemisia annua]